MKHFLAALLLLWALPAAADSFPVEIPAGTYAPGDHGHADLQSELDALRARIEVLEAWAAGAPDNDAEPTPTPLPQGEVNLGWWVHHGDEADWDYVTQLVGKEPEFYSGKMHMDRGGFGQLLSSSPVFDRIALAASTHPDARAALIFDIYPRGKPNAEFANIANGVYDDQLRAVAARLREAGCTPERPCVARLWHEFNLSSRLWHEDPHWMQAWRRVVTVMREVAGEGIEFQYNINGGSNWATALVAGYPGDAWVDRIAAGCYHRGGSRTWSIDKCLERSEVTADFAAEHGKAYDWPEWGLWKRGEGLRERDCGDTGHGDDPEFVRRSLDQFAAQPHRGYILFFNWHPCVDVRQFPESEQAFRELFGG